MVHPIAILINGEPQTTTHLLPPGNGVIAVLQHTDNKDIRIVTPFTERRMRKDEPDRLFKRGHALSLCLVIKLSLILSYFFTNR